MILLIILLQSPPRPILQMDTRPAKPALRMLQTLRTNPEALDAALAEVNAKRAGRGLPPYAFDPLLTIAAQRCCAARAARLVEGHLNDFSFLPPGAHATAAGCAALEPSWGWGSCCTYDRAPTHAGAAIVMGRDGRRYMQLFVR